MEINDDWVEQLEEAINEFSDIELKILQSGISLDELIFQRLDMSWQDLFYDLYYRIQERSEHFEDL